MKLLKAVSVSVEEPKSVGCWVLDDSPTDGVATGDGAVETCSEERPLWLKDDGFSDETPTRVLEASLGAEVVSG